MPYHKGHLVPGHTYSSTPESFSSTFQFTNAVPQRPRFNSGKWAQFEKRIRRYAKKKCVQKGGVLFLLTGSSFAHITKQGNNLQAKISRIFNLPAAQNTGLAITIPNSMWTAGCCVKKPVESFAVIGNNVQTVQEGLLTLQIPVARLQNILRRDVGVNGHNWGGEYVNLFPGNPYCQNLFANVAKLPPAKG